MRLRKSTAWFLISVTLLLEGCGRTTPPSTATTSPPTPVQAAPSPTATVAAEASPLPPTPTPEPLAAIVNGTPILLADYERQVALYEASMGNAGQDTTTEEGQQALAEARRWVLDRMIEQVLIEQAAAQAGITVDDAEVEAAIQALKADLGEAAFEERLRDEGMTLDEMRAELRREMIASKMASQIAAQIPTQTEHIHARHILVDTEEEARQLLDQIRAGADFAELARRYSQDASTRDAGGDLGFFPRGILTSPEVEEAAFALQPGQISDVIRSELGYHIIQVVERDPAMEVSPENLRLLRDKAVRTWLEGLWAKANVQRLIPIP